MESIVLCQEGNKRHKNRMIWAQIFKDTEGSNLIPFQNDLIAFVQKIRFRNPINHFPETDQYLWKINLKKQRGTTQKINGNGNK